MSSFSLCFYHIVSVQNVVGKAPCADFIALCGDTWIDELHTFLKYGIIADTILQNIYLQNMYDNSTLLKHLLFIIGNLPANRRNNLEIVPLAGLSNPDIEIQDLSVKCFEAWEDKRHLPTLINLRDQTNVQWFKDYISDVIAELSED